MQTRLDADAQVQEVAFASARVGVVGGGGKGCAHEVCVEGEGGEVAREGLNREVQPGALRAAGERHRSGPGDGAAIVSQPLDGCGLRARTGHTSGGRECDSKRARSPFQAREPSRPRPLVCPRGARRPTEGSDWHRRVSACGIGARSRESASRQRNRSGLLGFVPEGRPCGEGGSGRGSAGAQRLQAGHFTSPSTVA